MNVYVCTYVYVHARAYLHDRTSLCTGEREGGRDKLRRLRRHNPSGPKPTKVLVRKLKSKSNSVIINHVIIYHVMSSHLGARLLEPRGLELERGRHARRVVDRQNPLAERARGLGDLDSARFGEIR